MTHAEERLSDRIAPKHADIAKRMLELARNSSYYSTALVYPLAEKIKANDTAKSNGDNLVVIVRGGYIVTIMYCRSAQINPQHLRVVDIVKLNGQVSINQQTVV